MSVFGEGCGGLEGLRGGVGGGRVGVDAPAVEEAGYDAEAVGHLRIEGVVNASSGFGVGSHGECVGGLEPCCGLFVACGEGYDGVGGGEAADAVEGEAVNLAECAVGGFASLWNLALGGGLARLAGFFGGRCGAGCEEHQGDECREERGYET